MRSISLVHILVLLRRQEKQKRENKGDWCFGWCCRNVTRARLALGGRNSEKKVKEKNIMMTINNKVMDFVKQQ